MRKVFLIALGFLLSQINAAAQHSAEATLEKFTQLTGMFRGAEPFSCYAIVEVKYKNTPTSVRDTSLLIYRNGMTHYKSKLVEHVEAPEGELIVNHELKTVTLHVSDSIREIVHRKLNVKIEKEVESMLESNSENKDLAAFSQFLVNNCYITWTTKDGLDEISFTPKNATQATLLSMKVRFDENSKLRYYEYTNREVYATDWNGDSRFRLVRTIYDNFRYSNVPDIPSKLTDFLEWKGWAVKLIKHTNYKFSVL